MTQEKRGRNAGFRALSKWAAGEGTGQEKNSPEEQLEDAIRNTAKAYREGVIWFLDWKLGEVARVQRDMMETRLEREVEKSKSALYKTRGFAGLAPEDMGLDTANGFAQPASTYAQLKAAKVAIAEDAEMRKILEGISPEQLQMFEQENSDMLRQYEETLDQVRYSASGLFHCLKHFNMVVCRLLTISEGPLSGPYKRLLSSTIR